MTSIDHISPALMVRYVSGDSTLGDDALWAVEAHLEECASCRNRLSQTVSAESPQTAALLERVRMNLRTATSVSPQMPARRTPRWLARWTPPGFWPRLAMTVLVVVSALTLDLVDQRALPIVLLLAPVAPMIGVAAVWTSGTDPAHELVVASPRAGLYMVLRRTLAVLIVVIPLLTLAGWLVGASPVRWLLPCMAFTSGALALGELIGLHWAAGVLTLAWTAGVLGPTVLTSRSPLLLEPVSLPYWAGLAAVCAVALLLRRGAYTGMRGEKWFVR